MNIIDLAKSFVHSLESLAKKTAWDWRRCPRCSDTLTNKHGHYIVHPWFLDGRREISIQRHYCQSCQKTYSEQSPHLVRGSWYAREVHRYSIDLWLHGRSSIRRSCEFVRSLLGRQERWLLWRLFETAADETLKCRLSASTLERWLDRAGVVATETVAGQLEGIASSGQVGVDGLWAKLKGKTKRVVLVLVDSVTGLIYPPVVVTGEENSATWAKLFERAKLAGFSIDGVAGGIIRRAVGETGCRVRVA
jgi:transposase-like protein